MTWFEFDTPNQAFLMIGTNGYNMLKINHKHPSKVETKVKVSHFHF